MSVLIKGMEMPESCICCDIETSYNYCPMLCRDTDDIRYDGRLDDCPLVDLPEKHGRLFDSDEVKKVLDDLPDSEDKWSAIALLEWAIDKRWCIKEEGSEE